jgi:hypothetical protein
MKHLVSGLALAAAISAVIGCADDRWGYSRMYYATGATYNAYYDNFYGPIYDGYWSGGTFNFRSAADRPFQQDTAGHFRKDPYQGFGLIHGDMHPGIPSGALPPGPPPQQ